MLISTPIQVVDMMSPRRQQYDVREDHHSPHQKDEGDKCKFGRKRRHDAEGKSIRKMRENLKVRRENESYRKILELLAEVDE